MSSQTESPKKNCRYDFILRRLHSIMGIFLVLFLIEHLVTNSQAALFFGEDGIGFIRMVNLIHSLPYLPFIEIGLLLVPFVLHMIWGIIYLRESRLNHFSLKGDRPSLPYHKNINFTWQRLSAWLLVIGVVGHIIHMRVLQHPTHLKEAGKDFYINIVEFDPGLYTLAPRLEIDIWNRSKVDEAKNKLLSSFNPRLTLSEGFNENSFKKAAKNQMMKDRIENFTWMQSQLNNDTKVALVSKDFGTSALMLVRNAFKNPILCVLYSIYVLMAVFHACNGLWSASIVWGVTPSRLSQTLGLWLTRILMVKLSILGLCAIWLSYYINLFA